MYLSEESRCYSMSRALFGAHVVRQSAIRKNDTLIKNAMESTKASGRYDQINIYIYLIISVRICSCFENTVFLSDQCGNLTDWNFRYFVCQFFFFLSLGWINLSPLRTAHSCNLN